ncbi:hypothetical protein MalM25_27330 [Planctomycetes bacterium MalM25]|nr:hypothetical protein MalM25_27330 [Planctomycetes bacterium MalM25]
MHTIRLRAAWETAEGRGTRRFNRPTGLDAGTRVWIAWDGPANDAVLNGEAIDNVFHCGPPRFDITERLRPANVLELGTDNGAVLESVRLEIVEPESAPSSSR